MKITQNKYLLKKRLVVLKYAKLIVPEYGFNNKTFEMISNKYNLDINEIKILFPEGNIDLLKFALDQLNKDLEVFCKKFNFLRMPIHKRIRKILLSKIFLMNQEKKFYKKIFLKILIPNNNFITTNQLFKSIDQMWFMAGDNSTDFNFYTKRLILAGIYMRIILFFFNNNDQNQLEKILDTNLKRVSKIPELKSRINIFRDNLPKIIKFVKNFN